MTDNLASDATPARPFRARISRLRRPGAIAALGLLAISTLYLVVMTALWWTHTSTLQDDAIGLRDSLVETNDEVTSTMDLLDSAKASLDEEVDRGIGLANNKAQGEDYVLLFADVAGAMSECASEMGEVVEVTYNRHIYVAWTVRRYENEVAAFCAEVAAAVGEMVTELEEALK